MLKLFRSKPRLPPVSDFESLFGEHAFENWACLGAVTDRSVRVWLRSVPAGSHPVALRVDGSVVTEGTIETIAAHDCVGVAELAVSTPMPGKAFTVEVAGMVRQGTFAPEPQTGFSFLFGSCNQPFKREGERAVPSETGEIYGPMLDVVRRSGTSFSLLVGDQAYADGIPGLSVPEWAREQPEVSDDGLLTLYRQVYRAYFGHPGFHALLERMPSYLIWDDHEIFDCWGSNESIEPIDRRLFESARKAYLEYQHPHNPDATPDDTGPLHYEFWYGCAGFFVFDLRTERNYSTGSLIGEAQWDSFRSFLESAARREVQTVFIVATTPVIHFPPTGIRLLDSLPGRKASLMRERWDSEAFLPYRERLLNTLFAWQSEVPGRKVVLLSGDVHAAGAFRVHRKAGEGVLTQWTSSALSTPGGFDHLVANRVGSRLANWGDGLCRSERIGVEPLNNFGLVNVTPGQGQDDVELSIYKFDAQKRELRLSFSDRV